MWKDWRVVRFLRNSLFEFEEVSLNMPIVQKEFVPPPSHIIEASTQANKGSSLIKKIGLAFLATKSSGSSLNYEGPMGFSFDELQRAYHTDSYIRSSVDKHVDFIFKSGFDIVGKNPEAVAYIKKRLSAIEMATQKPLPEFLNEIAENIIKYHNCFIIKSRGTGSYQYPAGLVAKPFLYPKTVAGYFILPVSTITIARDQNGTIKKYKQEIPGYPKQEIKPEDMIHISVDKPTGYAFGTPYLWQALDDVKLLRQLEELADRAIYKNIFPLIVYKVGIAEEGQYSTDEEIEDVKTKLGELPMDGGIVIPERHDVKAMSMEGKAVDISPYLAYFKKRVFTGLGVSSTIMGEADTANRSTSDNLDQMFKDRIKAYQRNISEHINAFIITELLQEGGYDLLTDETNKVEFIFREIDLEAKMAEQNHVTQLFTQNLITHEQARTLLGMDPVTPEEENRLYFKMITATLDNQQAKEATDAANNAGANKNQPANQNGTRTAAKTTKNTAEALYKVNTENMYQAIHGRYDSLIEDVSKYISQYLASGKDIKYLNVDVIKMMIQVGMETILSVAAKQSSSSFMNGAEHAKAEGNRYGMPINYQYNVDNISNESKALLRKVFTEVQDKILSHIEVGDTSNTINYVNGLFESYRYRLRFIAKSQAYLAYNEGYARAARAMGFSTVYLESDEGKCDVCTSKEGTEINIYSDVLPPFHTNCTCRLTLIKKEVNR